MPILLRYATFVHGYAGTKGKEGSAKFIKDITEHSRSLSSIGNGLQ
jgi:hypothetical protein